jgi:hypothetical protein
VPPPQTLQEDGSLAFSAAAGNALVIADPDATELRISLSVTSGTVTLGTATGLTFLAGADGESAMTFFGAIANLNAALTGLRYDPAADFHGTDTLSISTEDLGFSGAGGAKTTTSNLALTIAAVNDPPTFQPGADISVL